MQKCSHCGSTNIEKNVRFGIGHEANKIGPKYLTRFLGMRASAVEEVKSDICLECGTIVRLYANLEKLSNVEWDKR